MAADFDIAVIGSGFAGSLVAMIAKRLGRSVILLERGRHPRFAIGESSTPLANLLLEELARRYDLPRLLPLTKWGTWQRTYPEIGCGLKRGFSFYHHEIGKHFGADPERRDQLLVAASPRDEIADTHWYRPDFDHFLVREAQALGVEYLDELKLGGVSFFGETVCLEGERSGKKQTVRARFIVDASGPNGFLHRALDLPETRFDQFPSTQTLYTHFRGVRRWDELRPVSEPPPYPIDDAALHHIFEGGWIWVLRFNNGITSAGIAATEKLARELVLGDGAAAWRRLLRCLPSVREQFEGAEADCPFKWSPKLAFRCGRIVGPGWALLPSAAGVVDPLLSTGFPLTLLGISRLARLFEEDRASSRFADEMTRYGDETLQELDVTAGLVAALYASMDDFEIFTALALFYFAAASFSETARRVEHPELAPGFLLCGEPRFARRLAHCCGAVLAASVGGGFTGEAKVALMNEMRRAIEPFDVAGLSDAGRRNWFPVRPDDLLRAAPKLSVSETKVRQWLASQGMIP